jgi:hypothetical protein
MAVSELSLFAFIGGVYKCCGNKGCQKGNANPNGRPNVRMSQGNLPVLPAWVSAAAKPNNYHAKV